MTESAAQINEYLDYLFTYGSFAVYAVIFVACFIENIFPPFPGDTFILAAGGLVAVDRLDPYVAGLVVIAGGMSSVMLLYFLGRRYGRDYFIRKNFKYFTADDIMAMESRFRRSGAWLLVFSRFIVGMRSAVAVVAGIGRYAARRMFVFSAISYLLFVSLLMYIAFHLVEEFDKIEDMFVTYNRVAWAMVISIAAIFVIWKIMKARKSTR